MMATLLAVLLATTLQAVPVQPARPQPRDAVAPRQKGTAIIRGRVVTADGERPLRRAQIRVVSSAISEARTTSTNTHGAYEIRDLPAGRYQISVNRSGFLAMQYGQRYPGEPSTPVDLADGQVLERVDFQLSRAGVISGRVTDETGDAVAGVTMWPMQIRFYRGRRRLVPTGGGGARTDDTGQYRLLRLPPGDYVVMGTLRETWTTRGKERVVMAYAPSYFPGTARAGDAQRVKVAIGQEVGAVDFSLVPGRVASVSGTATRADGAPLANAAVGLAQRIMGPTGGSIGSIADTRTAADGSWTLREVPPGDYELTVDGSGERAMMLLSVHGVDVEGVEIVTGASGTIAGRLATEDGAALPPGTTTVRIVARHVAPDGPDTLVVLGDTNGLVGRDGVFTITNVPPGPAMLQVMGLPKGWAVRRLEVGGQDYTQRPFPLQNSQQVSDVRILLTDRLPAVAGRIVTEDQKATDGSVLLFPLDPATWLEAAGTLRAARPDQTGTFRFDGVLPGQYFIIALATVQEWELNDPEFFGELRQRATKLTVGDDSPEPVVLQIKK